MKTVTQALANFIGKLKEGMPATRSYPAIPAHNAPELLDLWSPAMETQVNVIAAKGKPVGDAKGVYEDDAGNQFWNIRIPKNANTDKPFYDDKEMRWPPEVFAQGIGCTGWDWEAKVSRWVGFDFDAITGHAKGVGVDNVELERVKTEAQALDYVEVRKSTGGAGLHIYVRLDAIKTSNHTEHAALARCILGMMSSKTGFDFAKSIDACGGNMWIWHRKSTTENGGLTLIKSASRTLSVADLPMNWKDHVEVVRRKRAKVKVEGVDDESSFDKLASSQYGVTLDDEHRRILDALRNTNYACEWVSDHNCARIHTGGLAEIHDDLKLKGVFRTNSQGKDPGTPNGFMFPLPDGAWAVYRFSFGVNEAETWEQDGEGWTTCRLNVDTDLKTAARLNGGRLDGDQNGYAFATAEGALTALKLLGGDAPVPARMMGRKATLRVDKSQHITMDVTSDPSDKQDGYAAELQDWTKHRSKWCFTTTVKPKVETQVQLGTLDNVARLVKTPKKEDAGWLIRNAKGGWEFTARENAKAALVRSGVKKTEMDWVLGEIVTNAWTLVNLPFQPEYPGNRQINLDAPQFRFPPTDDEHAQHPTWDLMLDHCFEDLNTALPHHPWARANNVLRGRDYGLLWIACLLREPFQPLPYLFLFSKDENTGKSSLHESISLLVTAGVIGADKAFKPNTDFNGELANAILPYIEETDLSKAGTTARNRLKAWVTGLTVSIRKMRTDAYDQPNTLHFIQTANDRKACPVDFGDTRITMMEVRPLEHEIPRTEFRRRLEAEAPAFMQTVLGLTLPSPDGRLRIPAIETESKSAAQQSTRPAVLKFVDACCEKDPSYRVSCKEFGKAFREWCDPDVADEKWTTQIYDDLESEKITKGGRGKMELLGIRLKTVETRKESEPSQPISRSVSV
ncbi:hypothetical protein Pan44_23070 [Caulifigura coniformis]|uniref:NrS-1 polymerase-like helicase domain-containing protein n=1 Tax=Caulifigura coniformis TaxID=2527983 RepID=A0A517SDT0_9PLAN|nr:DUF5906 domain-containing protein [Caulifigura coniformis]QDT54279.1 hypothetical protein Pan44_23070 [Caulifigura coniformis]